MQVPQYRVAGDLAAGRLKIILANSPPPPMPVSVLYPQNRQLSSRVRVFAQWLRDIFEAAEKAQRLSESSVCDSTLETHGARLRFASTIAAS